MFKYNEGNIKSSECKLLWWWDAGRSKVVKREEMRLDELGPESTDVWCVCACVRLLAMDYFDIDIDIFVNCNWVNTRWQWFVHIYTQTIHRII
jgi:hypothetical protein